MDTSKSKRIYITEQMDRPGNFNGMDGSFFADDLACNPHLMKTELQGYQVLG